MKEHVHRNAGSWGRWEGAAREAGALGPAEVVQHLEVGNLL